LGERECRKQFPWGKNLFYPGEHAGGRIKMTAIHENDRFRSRMTGNVYEVKKIADKMVVLESLNGTSQVLTELNNIALFYEKEPKKIEDQR
jgi:hypothetical protein